MVPCEEVQFLWNANNEGMIWTIDGISLQGLTGRGLFGNGLNGFINPPDSRKHFTLEQVELTIPHKKSWQLLYDLNNS
ncbi:hypothetical protein Glove_186g29 [Diversispora epigaea]|uniref:Uncharacterized protein n=1 Tax=Diversispora epigaea TaxID=1348612 RepID=A0A397IM39_9GLOM|nr:hypothetical protein Glove_186g29 [Diversispora epigaea]